MIFASSLEQICISDLKILIPDEGLRDYAMTGVEYFSEEAGLGERDYYKIFGNLLNLTFMYAFSCYEDLENRTLDDGDEKGGGAGGLPARRQRQRAPRNSHV